MACTKEQVQCSNPIRPTQACKGFMNLYPSRIGAVPRNEVPQLLSVQNKSFEVVENAWVRLKNGKYKGDLAQVYNLLCELKFVAFNMHDLLLCDFSSFYACFFRLWQLRLDRNELQ